MKKNNNKPVSIYQFKVTLNHVTPSIWRRFQVRSDVALYRLSTTILLVMDWDGGHLHQFRIGEVEYGIPHEDYEEDNQPEDEREIILSDIPQEALKKFTYEYDFGDGWEHTVVLEKVLESEKGVKYPVCLEGARSCPPEDCGGPHGYEDFLEAIKNPKHPEHESMLEWIGGEFDPEEFDLDGINHDLKHIDEEEKFFDGEDE